VILRETRKRENERRNDEVIPMRKAEAKMMRSATNNSWAYKDFFWVRECMDRNKMRYMMHKRRTPRRTKKRKCIG
jgi:predicted secreted protein